MKNQHEMLLYVSIAFLFQKHYTIIMNKTEGKQRPDILFILYLCHLNQMAEWRFEC